MARFPGLRAFLLFAALGPLGVGGCGAASGPRPAGTPGSGGGTSAEAPVLEYRLYVTNESSDIVSRVIFDPVEGARVEDEVPIGIMPDTDGPHGVAVDPDGEFWYATVAHGTPDGWLWKFTTGDDQLVSRTSLGRFPASVGTTPNGQFVLAVNFNLHGDPVPSSLSVVYAPDLTEVARVTSCVMPHGSRANVSGTKHYHVCMHSDQIVELDLSAFEISNRFSLAPGQEGLLDADDRGADQAHDHEGREVCSPTWVATGRGEREDRFVYATCNGADEVVEVDVETWEITRRFETGRAPYNLEASPDGRLLVVTLRSEEGVQVFDLESGREAAWIETSRPITHGVVMDPDSRYAFITNESVGGDPGTLDVIDLSTFEIVSSVDLRLQPTGVDLWRVDPIGQGPATGDR